MRKDGKVLHVYWTNVCQHCPVKHHCTPSKERRISRWEHEDVLERVQQRLEDNPDKMATRRETAEHPFGTIKAWMGATHFKMRTLKHVATEMALHVLAYNMMRVIAIIGIPELIKAIGTYISWLWQQSPQSMELAAQKGLSKRLEPKRTKSLLVTAAPGQTAELRHVLTHPLHNSDIAIHATLSMAALPQYI